MRQPSRKPPNGEFSCLVTYNLFCAVRQEGACIIRRVELRDAQAMFRRADHNGPVRRSGGRGCQSFDAQLTAGDLEKCWALISRTSATTSPEGRPRPSTHAAAKAASLSD